MSDIDISEPLSDMLAPLFKPTKKMKPFTVKEKRHRI